MTTAFELSESLATIVESAARSVVRVDARWRFPASGAVWSTDGTIVTASHVIEQEDEIEIGLPDGTELPATLVGRDHGTDLAILKVAASGLARPAWLEPDGLKVGHLVLSVSRPGRTARASSGIVSALSDSWRSPSGGKLDRYIESDIALRPGFSGSLLLDARGQVLGLNTAGLLRNSALAIPTATVRRVIESILAHGHVRRGFLGVGAHPVRLGALGEKLGQETGLLLASIEPGSPAEQAGLLLGDVLVAFDGQPVRQVDDLLGRLDEDRVGRAVTARILRAGEPRDVQVTVGTRG
jgi:S1-C subfamily serine protease